MGKKAKAVFDWKRDKFTSKEQVRSALENAETAIERGAILAKAKKDGI